MNRLFAFFTGSILLLISNTLYAFTELKTESFHSALTNQTLEFEISLPKNYQSNSDKRYPVFITTSGQSRIKVLHSQVNWLSHVDFGPIPDVIFVTLPNIDFSADDNKYDTASGAQYDTYAKVLTNELLPFIDNKYQTSPYRLVEGFSSFGNLPLYLLRHYSHAFNAFFIFSPALELDKSGLVDSMEEKWQLAENKRHFVYLSQSTFIENKPLFEQTKSALLKLQQQQSLELAFADHSQSNFLSGPNLGLIDASEQLFADLQPDYKQFLKSGEQGLVRYFDNISNKYQQKIEVKSKLVDLAFSYASQQEFDSAVAIMKKLARQYQKDTLIHVRFAQIYLQANNNKQATITLNNALTLAKNESNDEAISYIKMLLKQANG